LLPQLDSIYLVQGRCYYRQQGASTGCDLYICSNRRTILPIYLGLQESQALKAEWIEMHKAKLLFLCGKMAAGKSTLARKLAEREKAVLLVQDEFLERLFPGEIVDIPGFLKYSSRVNEALAPHICSLLSMGISVVLDVPGNTRNQRAWFRRVFESAQVEHELHFIDASDELCKRQLKERSKRYPTGTSWTTDAEFDAVTKYFEPPSVEEGFNVTRHERA
jgi:predicted kinase